MRILFANFPSMHQEAVSEVRPSMSLEATFCICLFVLVIALIATEKIHRTVLALAGSLILLISGIISFDEAIDAIDWNTLGVLCGMMVFVAVVKHSGLFQYIAIKAARLAKADPWRIMVYLMIITAVFSMVLDNVTTVLLVGPMTFTICRILHLNPVPFFITQIISSNIGGTATLIGDPPNIMLGSMAHIPFVDFLIVDAPCVVLVMVAIVVVFRFLYRKQVVDGTQASYMQEVMALDERTEIKDMALFKKSVILIALAVIAFLFHDTLGLKSSYIALAAGAIMLLIGRQNVEQCILDVEWPTLCFFVGLFILVGGLEVAGVIPMLAELIVDTTKGDVVLTMIVLLWGSALFSAVLDNIPFVAAVIPVVLAMGATGMDVTPLWWAISLGACFGGNGTLIGASANVVLSGISSREGYPITFINYLKVGFPIMVLSIVIATVYLLIMF